MANPPVPGQTFIARDGHTYTIDSILPPLTDIAGGVFNIVSISHNAALNTGVPFTTHIRLRADGVTWEEVPNDKTGAYYPNATTV